MRYFLPFLIICLFTTGTSGQDMLRLDDAIAIGLTNNHRIVIARNNAEIAQNNTTRGNAVFLPSLDASGSLSLAQSEQETNSPFSFGNSDTRGASAQLALNWTVFDGFQMFAERNRYNELARLGEAQARNTVEQTVVSIVAGYMDVVQQTRLLDALRRVMEISRSRFEKESVRRELGGSATDYLNARIAYNTDSASVLRQKLQLLIARQELNISLGREPSVRFDVENAITLPDDPGSYTTLLEMAQSRNADLTVLRQNLRVTEALLSTSRSTFYPRVNLFANYGYSDRLTGTSDERFSDDISTQSTDAAIGLSFTFNLFNGFRNATDIQNAALNRRSAATAIDEAEIRLAALLREQMRTLEIRLQAVAIEESSLDAARRNLDLQVERFQTGTVTSLEFRDAQLQFVRAETAYIVARFQAHIADLELRRLTGDLRV